VKHIENLMAGVALGAGLVTNPALAEEVSGPRFHYHVECIGADGELKWVEDIDNLVTTEGKNDILDKYFKGSAYTAAWFLGLKGAGAAAAGDTLASHASWTEVTPYTGNRPAITFGTTAAGSNTATVVAYAITLAGPTTVAGAFVASVNTGTAGKLYSAGDFATSRSVVSGDTLNVTLTVSVS
jgi:hypothetical protein